jgi:hypothetical protein
MSNADKVSGDDGDASRLADALGEKPLIWSQSIPAEAAMPVLSFVMLWGEIRPYLPVIFRYLQGSLTLIIAIVAVYIALQQWKTNRQKLTLDLYDRR